MSENYLVQSKTMNAEDLIFNVKKPGFIKWIQIFFVTILLNFLWLFTGLLALGLIVIPIIAVIAQSTWDRMGSWIMEKVVISNFKEWDNEKKNLEGEKNTSFIVSLIKSLLGLNLLPQNQYYIDANVKDLDVSKIKKVLRSRIVDLLSSCLGIVVLLGTIFRYAFAYNHLTDQNALTAISRLLFFILIISPIFVGWLTPVIWQIQDAEIREIDDNGVIEDMANKVRRGLISRFLGFAGFLGGLSLMVDLVNRSKEIGDPSFKNLTTIGVYLVALLMFILVLTSVAGTAYYIAMVYLSKHHEEKVNYLRKRLFKYMPLAIISVRTTDNEETTRFLNYFGEYENTLDKKLVEEMSQTEEMKE